MPSGVSCSGIQAVARAAWKPSGPGWLGLSGLAIGVASVTLCLASGFIFDNARDTPLLGSLACIALGSGGSLYRCFTLRCFGKKARLLLGLCELALSAPLIPRHRDGRALCLSCEQGRLGSFLRGEIGPKKCSFGVGGSAATVCEFAIGYFFQTLVPIDTVQADWSSGLRGEFCSFVCSWRRKILRFFRKTRFA